MKTVSASEANRQFSALLREVTRGDEITITSHGKPLARITPAKVSGHGREAARQRLIKRLGRQGVTGERSWSRAELYE